MSDLEISSEKKFEVKSNGIRVSDPCYKDEVWCAGSLENVKNGEWKSFVVHENHGDFGVRVKSLNIVHGDVKREFDLDFYGNKSKFILSDIEVGVDSGQAGFFDLNKWMTMIKESSNDDSKFDAFYDFACSLTYNEKDENHEQFGVGDYFTVSSSGFGDGGYELYYRMNEANEIVEAIIVFIDDENDEYSDEDDDDE